MRPLHFLLLTCVLSSFVGTLAAKEADASAREAALERLLSERESLAALEEAIIDARKHGITEQAILETRFLYHVDRSEDDAIAALLPEFMKRRDTFRLEESEIFSVREDWLAVTEYVQAIAALKKDDTAAFKKHITEAFWLSPRQGAAFAPHIDRLRLEEAMKAVKVDFSTTMTPLSGGGKIPLSSSIGEDKAILLHFWSPWSRECESFMPDFAVTATELLSKQVAVISILPETSQKILADAHELLLPLGEKPPGTWLVDRKKNSISRMLRVQSVPTMVLLDKEGRVLFNGHPADQIFWQTLSKIDPAIKRPVSDEFE